MKTILILLLSILVLYADESKTYMDKNTGLMWQNNSDVGVIGKAWVDISRESAKRCLFVGDPDSCADTNGDTAASYCQNLQLDGFDDWRLPTIDELGTLGHNVTTDPLQLKLKGSFWSMTSALYKGKPREAAYIIMYSNNNNVQNKYMLTRDKSNQMFVRCVRGKSSFSSIPQNKVSISIESPRR